MQTSITPILSRARYKGVRERKKCLTVSHANRMQDLEKFTQQWFLLLTFNVHPQQCLPTNIIFFKSFFAVLGMKPGSCIQYQQVSYHWLASSVMPVINNKGGGAINGHEPKFLITGLLFLLCFFLTQCIQNPWRQSNETVQKYFRVWLAYSNI